MLLVSEVRGCRGGGYPFKVFSSDRIEDRWKSRGAQRGWAKPT